VVQVGSNHLTDYFCGVALMRRDMFSDEWKQVMHHQGYDETFELYIQAKYVIYEVADYRLKQVDHGKKVSAIAFNARPCDYK